jgi:hypothetical protein
MYIGYWWESERERPLGRPRRKWLDNIRMDLVEVGWCDVDWIGLAQGKLSSVQTTRDLSSSAQRHGVSYI